MSEKHQHIFILCTHSSGTTALWRLLGTSPNVASLAKEGQFLPSVRDIMRAHPWDENHPLPWPQIKQAWYEEWDLSKPILLDKTPPSVIAAFEIEQVFEDAYFVVMVRDPYAYCEGTKRRGYGGLGYGRDATYAEIAQGWVREGQYQLKNIDKLERTMWLTYEQLTENSAVVVNRLLDFMPQLQALDTSASFSIRSVEGRQQRPLVNLNGKQIARLSAEAIDEINGVLSQHKDLLSFFGYELLSSALPAQFARKAKYFKPKKALRSMAVRLGLKK